MTRLGEENLAAELEPEINWDFICLAQLSVADTAIISLQDVLGLGSEARMNLTGTTEGSWRWHSHYRELSYVPGMGAFPTR